MEKRAAAPVIFGFDRDPHLGLGFFYEYESYIISVIFGFDRDPHQGLGFRVSASSSAFIGITHLGFRVWGLGVLSFIRITHKHTH